jgi:hypothetical protein
MIDLHPNPLTGSISRESSATTRYSAATSKYTYYTIKPMKDFGLEVGKWMKKAVLPSNLAHPRCE